jgi:hypothetical protein
MKIDKYNDNFRRNFCERFRENRNFKIDYILAERTIPSCSAPQQQIYVFIQPDNDI